MHDRRDTIEIRRLKVSTHIGVPEDERQTAQSVWITCQMIPSQGFQGLADDISRTIDYHAVAMTIREIASARPRKLIETLATDLADYLLRNHSLASVDITVEKQILPDTDCVAVRIQRSL